MLLLYALARPILSGTAPSSEGNSTVFDPVTGECDDIHGCRTGSQILWNCLSVIFICTWVAIHPNVPHVDAHRVVVLFCNGMLMAIAMIAPELIILWAAKQRYSAKEISMRFEKYGWGMAHGFLVIMGGFAFYDNNKFYGYVWNDGEVGKDSNKGGVDSIVRDKIQERHRIIQMATAELDKHGEKVGEDSPVPDTDTTHLIAETGTESEVESLGNLNLKDNTVLLEFLLKHGYITITEDEIMDNLSHSDSITKIIAVVQTAWFLLQVGARAKEGLAITELEIITVGFAVLNFGTYFLWWNKPLRVRHPVRVYWRQQELVARGGKKKTNGWMAKIWKFFVGVWESIREASVNIGNATVVLFNFLKDSWDPDSDPDLNNNSLPDANPVTLLQLVGLPFLVVFRLIAASINIIGDDPDYDKYMAYVVSSSRLEEESSTLYILVYGLTTLFGAIHCIPWNFQFPTDTEQLLWRISAGGLVVLPIGMAVVFGIVWVVDKVVEWCGGDADDLFGALAVFLDAVLLPLAYIVARITLMVLALTELRKLPQSAYQTVQWTTIIPHIG